jgi:NADH-quinone oxidoreductase subunit C
VSQAILDRLSAQLGDRILSTSDAFGDFEAVVAPKDWVDAATFLRDDAETQMDHFIDITAIDYPERADTRFDVTLMTRSSTTNARIRLRTRVKDGEKLGTLSSVWLGANWAEREVFDMFGIEFDGHPDMRRILMYEEFVGHPLRKDYPIDRTQPLVPYRDVTEIEKLPPFGIEEGQPFARIDWEARLAGRDNQVSPSLGVQLGQRRTLSDSEAAQQIQARIDAQLAAEKTEDQAAAPTEESSRE